MKHLFWRIFKRGTEKVEVGTGRAKVLVTMSFSTQGKCTTFIFSPHPGKIKQACTGNTLEGILEILESKSRAVLAKAFPREDVTSWEAYWKRNGEGNLLVFAKK